jgi:hypothetical protein
MDLIKLYPYNFTSPHREDNRGTRFLPDNKRSDFFPDYRHKFSTDQLITTMLRLSHKTVAIRKILCDSKVHLELTSAFAAWNVRRPVSPLHTLRFRLPDRQFRLIVPMKYRTLSFGIQTSNSTQTYPISSDHLTNVVQLSIMGLPPCVHFIYRFA